MELHIYPCFDNLLYFPIYLAIDTFQDREGHAKPEVISDQATRLWRFDDLTIILEPPSPAGDAEAINNLVMHRQSSTSLAVAVADPMIVLRSRNSNPNLRILATFIDRIALWFVAHYSPRSKKGPSAKIRELLDYVDKYGPPLQGDFDQFNDLRIAYCPKGFTTDYVIKYFMAPDPIKVESVDDFGEKEISPLLEAQSDIAFTNVPWLAPIMHGRKSRNGKMEIRQWFPPIPFPFSSVITTTEATEIEAQAFKNECSPIGEFIRHLYIAVSLSYRYERSVAERLHSMRHNFRNYGLRSTYRSEEVSEIISQAVRNIVESDCLSEELSNSWIFWDFAFEALAHGNEQDSVDWGKSFGDWYEGVHHDYVKSVLAGNKNQGFLKNTYHDVITAFIKRVGLEKPPLPWVEAVGTTQ